MPIPQEPAQGQEHQEQEQRSPEKLQQRWEQLQRLLGQLQNVLKQRADSLERRKERSGLLPEATPEERRQGLEVQRTERGRQQGMRYLSERMLELAGELLKYVNLKVTDVPQLGATQKKFEDVDQREAEQLKQEIEEHSKHSEEGPLPGSEQEQLLPHRLRERMYGAGQKVQQQTNELKRLNDEATPPVRSEGKRLSTPLPAPVSPVEAAALKIIQRDAAQMAAMRYQMARVEARRDTSAQHEAVEMAKQLGYVPSALANAIQGYNQPNSAVASATASYSPEVSSRQSSSRSRPRSPQPAPPANTADVAASHGKNNRRAR
ncbi:hypothetical protein ACFC09_00095 [Streptomyces sp. NPDC056161]|uniref:hypothetical protein n=1 Tax=Streptomyces sp. NPDC056161 TaxID=3345732 RepID=UPI0035DDDB5B